MADPVPKIGQTIETQDGRQGTIRYIGTLHIAAGNWLGLELPDATGKNDGSVKGERYFNCQPGRGIFVRKESMVKVLKQPATASAPKANGTTTGSKPVTRPRPSSGVTADVARKRQSLMSNGSGSAAGSRLSMRSPTKSPNKPLSASASSTTSTPRTGTPATTARTSDSSNKSRLSMSGRPTASVNGTTRSPVHTTRPSVSSTTGSKSTGTTRTSIASSRTSISGVRPMHLRTASKQEKTVTERPSQVRSEDAQEDIRSPPINEDSEEAEYLNDSSQGREQVNGDPDEQSDTTPKQKHDLSGPQATTRSVRAISGSRVGSAGNVESRAAQQRETEQLKAKIRTLEKLREEDQERLQTVGTLQSDKDRFEGIIQALQKKLRANQQELIELRQKCEQAEAQAAAAPERSPEHESELELATLDKEMAEERAESYQIELEALRAKHEELELELEIMREENEELGSSMSPEEKASAGWLQMERERERLRDALVMLRDMTQQNESDLKAEISELRESLEEAERTAGLYVVTAEKLTRAEETTKHLMGQLEAVETNDEVVEAMEAQREQQQGAIEQLKRQIQEFEEHIQVTDELEHFHVDEEKRLHAQLDESEALLNESFRKNLEQDRVIEDLEYTLTKFRDVVQGLQSDIDELRRSRDISDLQANEMSSKSRAMMDLNLRLQNNASKAQTKIIDIELNKVKAELASKHVEILNLFTPESFESERKPVAAYLCFGRVRSKATLVGKLLSERLRERSHLSSGEEVFRSFETMERMQWIAGTCRRFEKFMNSCSTLEFSVCGSALMELEPVERTIAAWIEVLRKDELINDPPEHLKRMQGILADLSEKLIPESNEAKAVEMTVQMEMVENYAESLAGQLLTTTKMVQSKLGSPTSEDEESLIFDKRMDQLATKSRTIKYLSGKVTQQLNDLYTSSMCLDETSWPLYEEAEQETETLTKLVRSLGLAVLEELYKPDREQPLAYADLPTIMTSAAQQSSSANGSIGGGDDAFLLLSAHLSALQSLVDDLQSRTSDLSNATEFERHTAPWDIRAKEIKNMKIIAPETQEELTRLERRNFELGSKISEREKTIEEMGMRVEIAEKRFKESKDRDNKDKALKEELEQLRTEKVTNEQTLAELRKELVDALQTVENDKFELEALRKTTDGEDLTAAVAGGAVTPTSGKIDESLVKQFELEADLLHAEIVSLQAAVRYLREENLNLRIPISEVLVNSARNSWLDSASIAPKKRLTSDQSRKAKLEREGTDVWSGLIDVAKNIKPVRLSAAPGPGATSDEQAQRDKKQQTSWQPVSQTTRYAVLRQREELEQWDAWRRDFIDRAKVATSSPANKLRSTRREARQRFPRSGLPIGDVDGLVKKHDDAMSTADDVVIVVQE